MDAGNQRKGQGVKASELKVISFVFAVLSPPAWTFGGMVVFSPKGGPAGSALSIWRELACTFGIIVLKDLPLPDNLQFTAIGLVPVRSALFDEVLVYLRA